MKRLKAHAKQNEHYYICESCAHAKGWSGPNRGATIHEDICPYCGEKKWLACTTNDFDKPGAKWNPKLWD